MSSGLHPSCRTYLGFAGILLQLSLYKTTRKHLEPFLQSLIY